MLKNIVTLKSRLQVTRPANLCTTCTLQMWCYLTATDSMGPSSLTVYTVAFWSFKVIETGTKPTCDFPLVLHCNYKPIFYCYCYKLQQFIAHKSPIFVVIIHPSLV